MDATDLAGITDLTLKTNPPNLPLKKEGTKVPLPKKITGLLSGQLALVKEIYTSNSRQNKMWKTWVLPCG